jgi:hypothetical protein
LIGLAFLTNIGGPSTALERRLNAARQRLPRALREDAWAFTRLPTRFMGGLLSALGIAGVGAAANTSSVILSLGLAGVLLTLVAAGVSNTVYNARHGGIFRPQPWLLVLWLTGIAAGAVLLAIPRR